MFQAPTALGCGRTGTCAGMRTEVSRFFLQNFFNSPMLCPHNEDAAKGSLNIALDLFHGSLQHFGGWKTIFFLEPPDLNEKILSFPPYPFCVFYLGSHISTGVCSNSFLTFYLYFFSEDQLQDLSYFSSQDPVGFLSKLTKFLMPKAIRS